MARQRALGNFKSGDTKVLVATDIAARGIDVEELSLVINYNLPNIPETYVHRIGRTGRAKASGIALSFCDVEERPYLRDIQKLINQQIPVVEDHPFLSDEKEELSKISENKQKSQAANHKRGGNNRWKNRRSNFKKRT